MITYHNFGQYVMKVKIDMGEILDMDDEIKLESESELFENCTSEYFRQHNSTPILNPYLCLARCYWIFESK